VNAAGSSPRLERTFANGPVGTWTLEAWVSRAPAPSGNPTGWKHELGTSQNEGPVNTGWTHLVTTFTNTTVEGIYARIEIDSVAPGDCIVVDDIRVWRIP